jgi:hypothetical protein
MRFLGLVFILGTLAACSAQGDAGTMVANGSDGAAVTTTLASNAAVTVATATGATKPTAKSDDPCDDERNPKFNPETCVLPAERVDAFVGTWRVTRAHVGSEGVQAASEDDTGIVGSEFALSTEEIKWTKTASEGFSGSDVCTKPVAGAQGAIVEKESAGPLIAAAKHWSISAADRAPLRRLGCQNAGNWGPESSGGVLIYPVGKDRLIMAWYDGVVLLVNRT